ncbi:hypothetical protein BDW69DRAFT_177577 [Aspergillus filifer]
MERHRPIRAYSPSSLKFRFTVQSQRSTRLVVLSRPLGTESAAGIASDPPRPVATVGAKA